MSETFQLPDWVPDWLAVRAAPSSREPALEAPHPPSGAEGDKRAQTPSPLPDAAARRDGSQQPSSSASRLTTDHADGFSRAPPREIIVTPSQDRMVNRKLKGIHLFMITINATLGTGLYWRGGQILQLGGPLIVLLAFLLVGLLSWGVMQCITEMLCIWPVPGALSVYVSEFVDVELGIAIGIVYWFVYSVSFAALIATSAAEFHFWPYFNTNVKAIDGGIIYVSIPLVLLILNAFKIEIFRVIEVVAGATKILFLQVIIIFLIAINLGDRWANEVQKAGPTNEYIGTQYWNEPTNYDPKSATTWFTALLMSISIATFAYVGIEIVAASALEARWPRRGTDTETTWNLPRSNTLVGTTVKFSAIYISVLVTIMYTLSSLLATFDISMTNEMLPRLSWVYPPTSTPNTTEYTTTSAFVAIAGRSGIPHLADVFNFFLVFTCLASANTNLYVASRALFGLTSRLDGGKGQPWYIQAVAWFGRTNRHKVPMRAVVFSALAFIWVPFVQLQNGLSTTTPIGMFVEILPQMGSVGVLIVWACECLAFIRYYHCIYQHRTVLEALRVSQVRRWSKEDYHDYPYRSHGQPLLAYLALGGCLFVLIIANGAALWMKFHWFPFLCSYLIVIMFIVIWVILKLLRNAKWSLVDLSNSQRVVKKLKDLHDLRLSAS